MLSPLCSSYNRGQAHIPGPFSDSSPDDESTYHSSFIIKQGDSLECAVREKSSLTRVKQLAAFATC